MPAAAVRREILSQQRPGAGLARAAPRLSGPGQPFYPADTVPPGVPFDPHLHGHWSRQVGDEPLVTAFVRG